MSEAYATSLRIALIIHSLKGGGAERLMSQLSSRWAATGHLVHLITLAAVETDAYALDQRVIRHGLGLMNDSKNLVHGALANLQRVRRLRRQVREVQPDFILSFCDRMNIVAASAAGRLGIPLWLAEHSDPRKQQLGPMWTRWRQAAYPRASGCVVLTEQIASWVRDQFSGLNIQVIPPAITTSEVDHERIELSQERKTNADIHRLLMLGRHSPEKNVIALLRAWKALIDQLPSWQLVIAGDGPQHSELIQTVGELGLDKRVEFTGWVSDPMGLMRSCDTLVLPSLYEGFPVTLLEAMSVGLPCVSTPSSDSVQALASSGAVELAESTTPHALAAALRNVLSSPSRRAQLSAAGRIVSAQYDWSAIGPRWDRLLPRVPHTKS